MRRYVVAVVVIAAWVGAWGWLGWRQRRAAFAELAPTFARPVPGLREGFLGLYAKDAPVGVLYTTVQPESRHGRAGVTARLVGHLRLRLFEVPTGLRLGGQVWYTPNPPQADLSGHLEAEGQRVAVQGHAEGGFLEGEVTTGGQTTPFRVPFDAAQLDASSLPLALPVARLKQGEEAQVRSLDLLSLRPQSMRLRGLGEESLQILGRTVMAQKVEMDSGGAAYRLWVGTDGELLQAITPFGLTLRAITRDEARGALRSEAPMDLVGATVVVPTGRRPFKGAHALVVRVSASQAALVPSDENQAPAGDRTWKVAPLSPLSPALPAALPADIRSHLDAEVLVQSDNPRIRALAAEITAGAANDWEKARRINTWVFTTLEKRPVASLPSALAVLDARVGDCNEHTVLAVALLRAAGLPARAAIGVVWSEDLDGFGYHAWPEVWLGRWVWMDPTFGQEVADATHIKLLAGGVERWPELAAFLGQLQLEVMEVK
ncbi:MAG TPA: transglutaminase-like domain-containing protein [Thermoanaerobaculaceae bacterium]|nr:transglutaminase-like domain-containing protein [Thermoanaerobaculaceae bacterium]HPS76970.1 transglutaminase-like domain-containing protein [Thermoanaerobaculaceae bacterium]